MESIDREELRTMMQRGDAFKLVMALDERIFGVMRIPGSIRFGTPDDDGEFARALVRLGHGASLEGLHPSDDVVVYCSDSACVNSKYACQALLEQGYTSVRRYRGGLSDWQEAGYPLEGEAAT